MSFRRALDENPAPGSLGDVTLRFEPSMLIGETSPGRTSWRAPALAWAGGALLGGCVLALGLSTPLAALLVVLSAGCFMGSVWLRRLERRRRAFVVSFVASTLRLDFVTPIGQRPRTLVLPFEAVRAVELQPQADGRLCLTVDFEHRGDRLIEVLAAFIEPAEHDAAQRLTRVLTGAFGLGSIPPASPYLETRSDRQPPVSGPTPSAVPPPEES